MTTSVRSHPSHVPPRAIVVAAAGNLEHQRFLDLVGPSLETLKHPAQDLPRETPRNHTAVQVIPKDLEQVHICLGMPGASQVDDKRFASHLLNVILGSSMSSRLFQEIREKRGLAYSVYSFTNSHEDTGLLGIYAGVGPENVRETLKVVMEQLHVLASDLIPEAELSAAKEYLKGSMYLNAESTDSRMNRLAKNEFLFGRYVPFEEIEQKIFAVTPEMVQDWFSAAFRPDELSLLLYGPVEPDVLDQDQSALGIQPAEIVAKAG